MKIYKLVYNPECRCHPCWHDYEPFFLHKETAEAVMNIEEQKDYGSEWEIQEVKVDEN